MRFAPGSEQMMARKAHLARLTCRQASFLMRFERLAADWQCDRLRALSSRIWGQCLFAYPAALRFKENALHHG
jgi:hypothetical protein